MDKYLKKLPLAIDGKTMIFPCVEIMALSALPKDVEPHGYVRFYEAFARRYRGRITHYQLNDSTKWKKFQAKDEGKVATWFSDKRSLKEPLLGITLHIQAESDDLRPPLFEMFFEHVWAERPRGMFRIALPVEDVGDDASDLLDLVDDAMAEFPVHWGTAGYAFHWYSNDTQIDKYANQWLGRHLVKHPGLATGDLMAWGTGVEDGVANIGWLTFVGDALVDRLGGRETLIAAIEGSGITLRQYGKGVALQAGPRPELGNVNRKRTLTVYNEVRRILQPVFAPDETLRKIDVAGLQDEDEALAWLRRFLP